MADVDYRVLVKDHVGIFLNRISENLIILNRDIESDGEWLSTHLEYMRQDALDLSRAIDQYHTVTKILPAPVVER